MRPAILIILLFLSSFTLFSQHPKKFQGSWIKMSVENLSKNEMNPDTLYTRYTFDKSDLYISFYPAWDQYKQEWSVDGNKLTIGFAIYHVDEITDSSLIITAEGFRRFKFLATEYLEAQQQNLDSIGIYNGKPLYKANRIITPRYTTGKFLMNQLTSTYEIPGANQFLVSFVVTENGQIENIKLLKGIIEGFDKEIIGKLQATSGSWKAASYRGKPVQTEMLYEIRFLDSLNR